jgi:hypothetical protein
MMVLDDTAALSPARFGQARLRRLAGAVAAQPGSWSGLVRFDAGRRWYRRLELADDHEVWLLSWLPGQARASTTTAAWPGAFAVAQGRVRERTVAAGHGQVRQRGVARRHQVVRHAVRARRGQRLRGAGHPVHAYSPPLTLMRRYELTESGLVHTATEPAEQDW